MTGRGEKNAILSGSSCRQKGMPSPEEAAERPALSDSTKMTGTNLDEFWQGKPERKDSLTHAGLHLLLHSFLRHNSIFTSVFIFLFKSSV